MSNHLALPEHGQFVTASQVAEDQLTIRLRPEAILEPDAKAFVINARAVVTIDTMLAGLRELSQSDDYVYAYWREGRLVIENEGGIEVTVEAKEFIGGPVELTVEELKDALRFSQRLYEDASAQERKAKSTLANIREVLVEHARRIEAKGANHASDTTAGVLYSQQLQFIERLLRELSA